MHARHSALRARFAPGDHRAAALGSEARGGTTSGRGPRAWQPIRRCQVLSRLLNISTEGGIWRCVVLGWDAQLRDVNKEIAELEDRISALKRELQAAQRAADAGRVQGILAVRERHLERATLHAQFIESRIAQGNRAAKHIPYAALASICISAAKRTAQADTAEALNALGKNFSAKAIAEASNRLFGDPSDGKGGGNTTKP
jgi:hypothetical protein